MAEVLSAPELIDVTEACSLRYGDRAVLRRHRIGKDPAVTVLVLQNDRTINEKTFIVRGPGVVFTYGFIRDTYHNFAHLLGLHIAELIKLLSCAHPPLPLAQPT